MSNIKMATPRTYFDGVEDDSMLPLVAESREVPMFFPLFFIQAPTGDTTPQRLSVAGAKRYYGAEAFDQNSKYFSHQTMGAIAASQVPAIYIRMVDEAIAKRAHCRLTLEVVTPALPVPLRDRDASGKPIPDGLGGWQTHATFTGTECQLFWHIQTGVADLCAAPAATPADLLSVAGPNGGAMIPVFDTEHPFLGKAGNLRAFRMKMPVFAEMDATVRSIVDENKTLVADFSIYQQSKPGSVSALVQTTPLGEDFATIPLSVAEARHPTMPIVLRQSNMVEMYKGKDAGGVLMTSGLGAYKVYSENIKVVQQYLLNIENANLLTFGKSDHTLSDYWMVNIFRGKMMDDTDLYSAYDSSVLPVFGTTNVALGGGEDGPVSEADLAALVDANIEGLWYDPAGPLADRARYPYTNIFDTGFPHAVKEKLLGTMAFNPYICVDACDQDMAEVENTLGVAVSYSTSLNNMAIAVPESEVYGTGTYRAAIWGSMGDYSRATTGRRYPLIMEMITKMAAMFGGSVKVNEAAQFGRWPGNRIDNFTNVSNTWARDTVRDTLWRNSFNYVQYANPEELFWPAMQTVYAADNSILNNVIVRQCICDVGRLQDALWVMLTNDTSMTQDEFAAESDRLFADMVLHRYGPYLNVEGSTTFTPRDTAAGYIWTHTAIVRGNVAKTVGDLKIIAKRNIG